MRGDNAVLDHPIEEGATPEQIARNGHVAVLLRRYFTETGMNTGDFHQYVLGRERAVTTAYPWLKAQAVPTGDLANRVARVLGVPRRFFNARDPDDPPATMPEKLKVPISWTNRGAVLPPTYVTEVVIPTPKLQGRPPGSTAPPLSFRLNGDGTARLTLDISLPTPRVTSILRVLLEAGLEEISLPTD